MPLDTAMVGQSTERFCHEVDARWTMAYAAGLGDFNPRYLDTDTQTVVAHPVFPVCLEWPVLLAMGTLPGYENSNRDEAARGVHAAHDLHIYRPLQAGAKLTTQATVVSLEQIKPGAAQTTRLDTVDEKGELVCRTYQLGISRGVAVTGRAAAVEEAPAWPHCSRTETLDGWPIDVPAGAAHVYTECARIYNPIHTDRAVALAAGLPDIILHGTATLALAVSRLVDKCLDGNPRRVRRLGGRFSAMVLMPSSIELCLLDDADGTLFFEVSTEDGRTAFSNGFLCYES